MAKGQPALMISAFTHRANAMEKFTIWYGAATPMVARGKHQCRLLRFAEQFKGWHTIGNDWNAKRAAKALAKRGCLELSGDQFRFTYPKA